MLVGHVHTGIAGFDDVALLSDPTLIDDDRAGFGFDIVGELPDPVKIGITEAFEELKGSKTICGVLGLAALSEHGASDGSVGADER